VERNSGYALRDGGSRERRCMRAGSVRICGRAFGEGCAGSRRVVFCFPTLWRLLVFVEIGSCSENRVKL